MDRRTLFHRALLAGLGASLPAEALAAGLAAAAQPQWALALGDVEADIAPRPLTRLHGRLPADLAGTLYRNGPALFRRGGTAVNHWFDGDGLVRAFRLADGRASLAARFVDTAKRRIETAAGRIVQPGFGTPARAGAIVASADDTNAANTHVIAAGGRLLALWEAGSAHAIDPATLATQGPVTFRPDLKGMPFLAHPKVEASGRIWNIGLSGRNAFVWRLSAAGALEKGQLIRLPSASYMHDFTMTARHLIIVCQPWLHERDSLPFASGMAWRPEQGTRVLVIDKADLTSQCVYELPALFFFHLGDGWEDADGTIHFDGCFDDSPLFASETASALVEGRYPRTERPLLRLISLAPDGRAQLRDAGITAEFPRNPGGHAGPRPTIHVGGYRAGRPFAQTLGRWDWQAGRASTHDFEPQQIVEEFVVAGRWLIGTTINLAARATELHVLPAADPAAGPVASFRADVALPHSFHGSWVAA
ncbi:MAG: carotenoid oxygenase family protein [Alphaproteobacteria bacterium]|nr:carotenoid oxygenase family protein [Alphaproteobacteria bacterium]